MEKDNKVIQKPTTTTKAVRFEHLMLGVLVLNAIRLLIGFFHGDTHPVNAIVGWFGYAPLISNVEALSWFYFFAMVVNVVSAAVIYALSALVPYLIAKQIRLEAFGRGLHSGCNKWEAKA